MSLDEAGRDFRQVDWRRPLKGVQEYDPGNKGERANLTRIIGDEGRHDVGLLCTFVVRRVGGVRATSDRRLAALASRG